MSDRFRNKYRIASTRLQAWNYGWNAPYFITICTRGKECFFGTIEDGRMTLSEIGSIVQLEWLKTPELRPDMNIKLGAFVVMPNHFHSIVLIGKNVFNKPGKDVRPACRDAMHCVSTPKTSTKTTTPQNQFGPQRKNLASIVRGFKSAVTKQARIIDPAFGWQPRYHDHIIRNEKSYNRIKQYILNNPALWRNDKHNT